MNTNANVDDEEIARFEALASRWWDPQSEFKPLHDINPLRLDYIDQRSGLSGKRVLDVGCGGGILAESMAARGAMVCGIDMGDAPLDVARLHALETGIELEYRKITVEALAEEAAASYDVVTCLELLEHVPDPSSIVAACAHLAKPGGQIFFSTINRNPKSLLLAIVGAEYLLKLLPKGTHDYKKFIKPSELSRYARRVSLQVRDLTGMVYSPFSKEYRLDRDVDVNYLMYCTKPGADGESE